MCFGEILSMRTLCDAYHKECVSHKLWILDIFVHLRGPTESSVDSLLNYIYGGHFENFHRETALKGSITRVHLSFCVNLTMLK